MYKGQKIILTICARGGSKGVPRKNIKLLLGKPLIAYSIEQAKSLPWIDRIVVSTDDREIKQVAEQWGVVVPFFRPAELATDTAPKIPVMIHAVQESEKYWKEKYDILVDLDPTSPLRVPQDIENCVEILFKEPQAYGVITATEASKNPYYNMVELDDSNSVYLCKSLPKQVIRRQDAPKVYSMNGSVYAYWVPAFIERKNVFGPNTKLYVMPEERSLDVDRIIDFEIIEFIMRKRKEDVIDI